MFWVFRSLSWMLALSLMPVGVRAQEASLVLPAVIPVARASVAQPSPLIVVGFAGGFVRRTDLVHGEVKLAETLRERYGALLHAEIFENHHGRDAYREIVRLVKAAPGVKPRIILYGHSWGASEAVAVARDLERDGVPVQLLVQVDGVRKRSSDAGHDDSVIPGNVTQAINFYQTEGLLHGRSTIQAANPEATQILDNVHLSYKSTDVPTSDYPWFARTFTRRHIQIESDPRVWSRVEALIAAQVSTP